MARHVTINSESSVSVSDACNKDCQAVVAVDVVGVRSVVPISALPVVNVSSLYVFMTVTMVPTLPTYKSSILFCCWEVSDGTRMKLRRESSRPILDRRRWLWLVRRSNNSCCCCPRVRMLVLVLVLVVFVVAVVVVVVVNNRNARLAQNDL